MTIQVSTVIPPFSGGPKKNRFTLPRPTPVPGPAPSPPPVGFDFYSGIADRDLLVTALLLLKYCRPSRFEKRLRSMVPTHRVVPAGDGEDMTIQVVSIPGIQDS
jgi:hypothetical protein